MTFKPLDSRKSLLWPDHIQVTQHRLSESCCLAASALSEELKASLKLWNASFPQYTYGVVWNKNYPAVLPQNPTKMANGKAVGAAQL